MSHSPLKGYSSFSQWNDLSEIKENEVMERDNQWFDDSSIDVDNHLGKWVCIDPKYALWYVFSVDLFRINPLDQPKPENVSNELWESFVKAWNNPQEYVYEINLSGAIQVLEDPDYGFLFIKPK